MRKKNPLTSEQKVAFRKRISTWRNNNLEKVKRSHQVRAKKLKTLVFSWYGSQCVCCGETELDFLTLDHIKDDGYKDRPNGRKSGAGETFYKKLRALGKENLRDDLQILCWNCQWGKKIGQGFCPHHPTRDLRYSSTSRLRSGLGQVEDSSHLDYPHTSVDEKNAGDYRDEMPQESSLSEDTVIMVLTAR